VGRYIIFLSSIFFAACSTPGALVIKDLDKPLVNLQKTAEMSLPAGRRSISANGREFVSNYFADEKGKFVLSENAAIRNQCKISILGDRRPYTVEVLVIQQKRTGGQYSQAVTNERIAKVVKRRFDKALHQRREQFNIIDDFRPY
jgi:hypothetical protein